LSSRLNSTIGETPCYAVYPKRMAQSTVFGRSRSNRKITSKSVGGINGLSTIRGTSFTSHNTSFRDDLGIKLYRNSMQSLKLKKRNVSYFHFFLLIYINYSVVGEIEG
jgi:hypothetical protein